MASSHKKVLVRTIRDVIHAGYLPWNDLLLHEAEAAGGEGPTLAMLGIDGRMVELPLAQVRSVAYVRDFNLDDTENPERLMRRTFLARPRGEGVWVRLTFVGGEVLEGLAALDRGLLDGAVIDRGIFLMPPDTRSNTQRMFVPRSAIAEMQLLAVVTSPTKAAVRKVERDDRQDELFHE